MAKNEPRRHHYIPQHLLRHFADADERVHVFDKLTRATRQQRTNQIALEKDLYVYTGEDGSRHNMEGLATVFDELGAEAIQKIVRFEGITAITAEERMKLSYFIGAQIIRTPHTRKSALAFNQQMIEAWGPDICNEETGLPLSAFTEQSAHNLTIGLMHDAAPEFAKHIGDKCWFLMKAPAGHSFYISDNPVTMHNLVERPHRGNLGLALPGIEIYLPLAPHLCLMMVCPKMTRAAFDVPETGIKEAYYTDTPLLAVPGNVEHQNSLQVCNAERFVFSANSDFSLVQDMIREHPDLAQGTGFEKVNVNPPEMRQ